MNYKGCAYYYSYMRVNPKTSNKRVNPVSVTRWQYIKYFQYKHVNLTNVREKEVSVWRITTFGPMPSFMTIKLPRYIYLSFHYITTTYKNVIL